MKIHNRLINTKLVAGNTDLYSNFITTILTRTGLHMSHSLWTIGNHINIDKYNTGDKPRFFFMTNFADSFMLHASLWHQLIRMFVFYHENSAQ